MVGNELCMPHFVPPVSIYCLMGKTYNGRRMHEQQKNQFGIWGQSWPNCDIYFETQIEEP